MPQKTAEELAEKKCKPCEGDVAPMAEEEARDMLVTVEGWQLREGKAIDKKFEFDDFYQTMAFVNAVAWIANRQDHHPDLQVEYGSCKVTFSTHSIGGLSENDFISAAKVEALLD